MINNFNRRGLRHYPKQIYTPLMAIKNKNLIFISTQPDTIYFHWQVEVYMNQFSKFGIADNCYILFAYQGDEPSEGVKKLKELYKHVYSYKDERLDKSYIPTIRPHLLAKFFKDYPILAKNFFYHDADIIFTKLPNFSLMLNDNISYLSDTISYIGYKYIMDCCKRYKDKYPQLADDDLFIGMCKAVNINPELVIKNQENSGGAQLLLKNTNWKFWEKCEQTCNDLYKYLCEYEKKYPIDHHIQKWTAEMWAILWDYWKMGGLTKVHKELDFSWATDTMEQFNSKNIFHLAGVTEDTCKDRFFKSRYTNRNVIDEYIKDNTIFDNVIPTSATYPYTKIIIECAMKRNIKANIKTDNTTNKVIEPTEPIIDTIKCQQTIGTIEPALKAMEPALNGNKKISTEIQQLPLDKLDFFQNRRLRCRQMNNIPINDNLIESDNDLYYKQSNIGNKLEEELKTNPIQSNDKFDFSKFIHIHNHSLSEGVEDLDIKTTEKLNPDYENIFNKFIHIQTNIIKCQKTISTAEPNPKSVEPHSNQHNIPLKSNPISIKPRKFHLDPFHRRMTHDINRVTPEVPKEEPKLITKFIIEGEHMCSNTYIMDDKVTCCNKNIWRSIDNKLIIFFNGSIWIITYASCEKDIGPMCGGVASNLNQDLFVNKWNFTCNSKVIKDVL